MIHVHEILTLNREDKLKDIEWYNLHHSDNKITVDREKKLRKMHSTISDELIFRRIGSESGDSPEMIYERARNKFKRSITEDPKKVKLLEEFDLIKR